MSDSTKESNNLGIISRPGIAVYRESGNFGNLEDIKEWRSIRPGDELWFFLKFGAEGTGLGGFQWWFMREDQMHALRFGYSDNQTIPTQMVVGLKFPNETQDYSEKRKERFQEFLWSMQVLLSAVTRFETTLNLEPEELSWLTEQMQPQRFGVIRFIKDGGEN